MNRRNFLIRLGVLIGSLYLPLPKALPKPVDTSGDLTPEVLEVALDYFEFSEPQPTIFLYPEDVTKLLREFYTPAVVNHIKAMSQ
ncbi:MAG: hypothetical protein KAV87_50605 [Desulfobacteraceae bacterium]|nr:hypothetical protein [Desulfobacteraceae bacterium]